MSDSCKKCRFRSSEPPVNDDMRCDWVDGTLGEAGDRMPEWAHALLREALANDGHAWGTPDRAETCPAYEFGVHPVEAKPND